jgi:hypothetical protein
MFHLNICTVYSLRKVFESSDLQLATTLSVAASLLSSGDRVSAAFSLLFNGGVRHSPVVRNWGVPPARTARAGAHSLQCCWLPVLHCEKSVCSPPLWLTVLPLCVSLNVDSPRKGTESLMQVRSASISKSGVSPNSVLQRLFSPQTWFEESHSA